MCSAMDMKSEHLASNLASALYKLTTEWLALLLLLLLLLLPRTTILSLALICKLTFLAFGGGRETIKTVHFALVVAALFGYESG